MGFPYDDDEELDVDGLETPVAPSPQPVDMPAPEMGEGPSPAMNPDVKDYIQKKFNLGDYSDDNRKKLVDENSGWDWRTALAGGLAAAGGKDPLAVAQMRNQQRQQAIDQFDKARGQKIQEYDLDRKFGKDTENDNMESSMTATKRALAQKMAPSIDFSKMSGTQIDNLIPSVQKLYEIDQKGLDRKEARDERRFQSGLRFQDKKDEISRKDAEKREGRMTTYGEARTEDDAKKLKDASAEKEKFDNALQEMVSLREKHGGGATLDREDVARGKQLSKDLMLAYKNMASLGVLSKSDQDILEKIIPADPLAYNNPIAAMQGQDPILSTMKKFKGDTQRNFESNLNQRLRSGFQSQTAKPGEKQIVKTQTNQKTGAKRVVYSDGTSEEISATAGR